MNRSPLPLFLALLALPVVTASAQLIGYTDGSQVNLLNAYNASLAISGTDVGSNETADMARFLNDLGAPAAILRNATTGPAATLDFGAVRNVKTITTTEDSFPSYGFTAATVETSNDGTTWATYTGGMTVSSVAAGSGDNNILTLNTSVNARYVRVTPTTYQNGASGTDPRWVFNTMRAFGSSGALAGDTNLTIIANGAFTHAQTFTAIGSIGDINSADIMAPALSPHATRTDLYNIGNGEGFQLDLGQTFSVNKGTMELNFLTATPTNPIVLTLSGSTDGTTFTTLTTFTWTADVSDTSIALSFLPASARYLDATFTSALDSDMRVSDFAFFQGVPEPQTWTLAALGASAILFRLRRKARVA